MTSGATRTVSSGSAFPPRQQPCRPEQRFPYSAGGACAPSLRPCQPRRASAVLRYYDVDNDRLFSWGERRSEKTRVLLNGMLDWQPGKSWYFKADTDIVLFPDRLLHFLRTLEAAVGTAQPLYVGKAIPPYFQVRGSAQPCPPPRAPAARGCGRQ